MFFPLRILNIILLNMEGKGESNVMDYLLVQNRKLKEEVQDLRELVKMNKVEIDVLSKNNSKNKYIEIISNYRIANDNNLKKIELLQAKIEEMISEKLMLEQLNSSATNELKAEEQLHKDRVQELQAIISELQRKLARQEKAQRSYDTLTGFVQRSREVFNPTEQAIQFKQREERLHEEVHLLKLEVARGKENEDNLLKINGILRHKVVTLQAKLAMPSKNFGDILDKSLKRLMMYFIETQRRLLTGEQSDSQGEEDLELIAPQLATYFGEQALRRQRDYNVPHLDLLKIRGSVANNNEKIKAEMLKRNHLTQQEKIERLQIELEYTRRELTKNIIDLREESERRRVLERICSEMEARNELLLDSNNKQAQKLNKLTCKIKESKEKQLKFVELDDTINDMSTTAIKMDNNQIKLEEHPRKVVPLKTISNNVEVYDTPEEYKVHLELLARDLAKNAKVQNLQKMTKRKENVDEQEWRPKLKRSTSNPFLYFNQRREEIMGVKQDILPSDNDKMRLEQTEIFPHNLRMDAGENLDDIYI